MISIVENDRDALRFLWWKDGVLREFRHCRVPFGISSSPFLLSATLAHHLSLPKYHSDEYSNTIKKLKLSFYVDDCVCSLPSKEEADLFTTQAKAILQEGGFDLRGWASNETVNNEDKSVLGLKWNLGSDELRFVTPEHDGGAITKRGLLSLVSKIFDPIGVTSPATIPPKLLLQECWKRKVSWEDALPLDLLEKFEAWVKHLHELETLSIPRRILDGTLHVMSDASGYAFGACVFLRCVSYGGVSLQLVSAKARLAPISDCTIPRLELLACCLGVRLGNSVKEAFESMKTYYWTDSMVALCWIKNKEPWSTFVGNRVKEIRQYSDVSDWRHIPGETNVAADLLSRGCNFHALKASQWWNGPQWLLKPESAWPLSKAEDSLPEALIERRKTVITATTVELDDSITTRLITHCSKYTKLLRVCGWIYRFIHNARKGSIRMVGELTTEEVEKAENGLHKTIQREWPQAQQVQLTQNLQLVDDDGLLRLNTKLIHGQDSESFKRPVFLPENHISSTVPPTSEVEKGDDGKKVTRTGRVVKLPVKLDL